MGGSGSYLTKEEKEIANKQILRLNQTIDAFNSWQKGITDDNNSRDEQILSFKDKHEEYEKLFNEVSQRMKSLQAQLDKSEEENSKLKLEVVNLQRQLSSFIDVVDYKFDVLDKTLNKLIEIKSATIRSSVKN